MVTIKKEKLQTLLDNFSRVCSMCDELDIYEHEQMDENMQKMILWTKENFDNI